jgi:hypothetical protein
LLPGQQEAGDFQRVVAVVRTSIRGFVAEKPGNKEAKSAKGSKVRCYSSGSSSTEAVGAIGKALIEPVLHYFAKPAIATTVASVVKAAVDRQ